MPDSVFTVHKLVWDVFFLTPAMQKETGRSKTYIGMEQKDLFENFSPSFFSKSSLKYKDNLSLWNPAFVYHCMVWIWRPESGVW